MDHKEYGVALILSPDRYPLVDAADADEAFFHDSLSTFDLQGRSYLRLPELSVKKKCCEHTHKQRQQSCADNPKHQILHNCVYYTQFQYPYKNDPV